MKGERMASRKKIICMVLALSLLLLALTGCAPKQKKFQTTYFEWFDTFCTLTAYANSQEEFDRYAQLCASYLEDYHKLLDIYHEYDGIQNLKTINDRAGETVAIDERLGAFLQFAKEIDALTNHTVNIGMGSALSLWHTARENAMKNPDAAQLPDADALSEAVLHADLNCLTISENKTTVCLTDEQMSLDAGALGKGYVGRIVSEALRNAGCTSFLLNLGGNTVGYGTKPDGTSWLVGIERPSEGIEISDSLRLENQALVTSGSYQRYFTVEGVRYHHIIDSETGYPENHFLSVSILCPDSALADALSTALFCMTEEEGKTLLSNVENTEALWILEDGTIHQTDGWTEFVQQGGGS